MSYLTTARKTKARLSGQRLDTDRAEPGQPTTPEPLGSDDPVLTVDQWKGESALTADQVLAVPAAGEERSATGEAVEWLKTILVNGPLSAAEIMKEAKRAGIQDKPLRSARERLGIKPKKAGFNRGCTWALPPDVATKMPQDAHDAKSQGEGIFGVRGHLRQA